MDNAAVDVELQHRGGGAGADGEDEGGLYSDPHLPEVDVSGLVALRGDTSANDEFSGLPQKTLGHELCPVLFSPPKPFWLMSRVCVCGRRDVLEIKHEGVWIDLIWSQLLILLRASAIRRCGRSAQLCAHLAYLPRARPTRSMQRLRMQRLRRGLKNPEMPPELAGRIQPQDFQSPWDCFLAAGT